MPIEYVIARKNQGEAVSRLGEIDRQLFQPVALPEGASPMAVTEIEPPAKLADAGCRWIASLNSEKPTGMRRVRQSISKPQRRASKRRPTDNTEPDRGRRKNSSRRPKTCSGTTRWGT